VKNNYYVKNEKYAVCLGTYASCTDRFITSGYHEELPFERIIEKVISTNGINGIEMDYPFMPPYGDDVSSLHKLKKILDNAGLKLAAIEIDHYSDTLWKFGALTSNDKTIRKKAIDRSKRGIDAAIELDTDQINLWFGQDGYDYPMEADYQSYWQYTIEGIQEIGEYRGYQSMY
jgi:xylose isomerase